MKNSIRMAVIVGMAAVSRTAFPSVDITALVREADNDFTPRLVGGTSYTGYTIYTAFDGSPTPDAKRSLINLTYPPSEYYPVEIYYTIHDTFMPKAAIVAESFVFYRANSQGRTPTRIRLEAYDPACQSWRYLGGTTASLADEVPTTASWEISIPKANRGDYRQYRFVVTENYSKSSGSPALDANELVIKGSVSERETLTWTGNQSSIWSSDSVNWATATGEPSVWLPFAKAVIRAAGVSVVGTNDVRELDLFGTDSQQVISGGALRFVSPALIRIDDGVRLTSDVLTVQGTDTIDQCAQGTRNAEVGCLPRSATNSKTGAEVVYWKNRRLSDITGFEGAKIWVYANHKEAFASHFVNDGETATVQFQCDNSSDTKDGLIGGKVEFRQVGSDVCARLAYIGYLWDYAPSPSIDLDEMSGLTKMDVRDETHDTNYGLHDILAISGSTDGLVARIGEHVADYSGLLPPSETNVRTGAPVTYARNMKLARIGDFKSATFVRYSTEYSMRPYFVKRTADSLSVQFQCEVPQSGGQFALFVAKVVLTEDGEDVLARLEYIKYKMNAYHPGEMDADVVSADSGNIGSGEGADYGCKDVIVGFGGSLHLDGGFGIQGEVCIDGGELVLGAANLTVANEFTGAGTLGFEPASGTQTAVLSGCNNCMGGTILSGKTTVTLARADALGNGPVTVGAEAVLAVGSDIAATAKDVTMVAGSTVSFAANASLCVDSLSLSGEGTVSIAGELGANTFRVGTTKSLSAAERRKLRYKGSSVKQTEDGWIVPGEGFILLFR